MYSRLILVPCHAIFVGDSAAHTADDEFWILEPFQKGEASEFCEHIRTATRLLEEDGGSLLIFSGGITRKNAVISEASSYRLVATLLNLVTDKAKDRVLVEEYARDSIENLAFALSLFQRKTGRLPEHVSVVGWAFKEQRFAHHMAALHTDIAMRYVGCGTPSDIEGAKAGERRTLAQFEADPLGNSGALLAKRRLRNPLERTPPNRHQQKQDIASALTW